MKQKEDGWVVVVFLVFALLVIGVQVRAFSRCHERAGYYDVKSWQCVVIPGAQVTIP